MSARIFATFAATSILLTVTTTAARADTFSSIFVYGDSLSDNGNLYRVTGGLAPSSPPYFAGRFSNGPVAVEQLAGLLNAPLVDFAFGGATTGVGNIIDGGTQTSAGFFGLPGMLAELQLFPVPAALAPSSLFIVWGGADDFEANGNVATAVSDLDAIIQTLRLEGATHILVPGLPNLGLTPEFYGDPLATAYTNAFNSELQASLPAGVTYADTDALLAGVVANPGAYGFTDTTTPCYDQSTGAVCSNPAQHLFWDDIHPTSQADAIIANAFAADLTPAAAVTPEPSTLVLLGTGVLGLAGAIRRRARSRA